MTEKRKNIIGFTILFLAVGIGLSIAYSENKSLAYHTRVTTGKITELTSFSKSLEVFVRFKYVIGEKQYEGLRSLPLTEKDKHLIPLNKLLLNKTFHVVYDSTQFKNSEILLSNKQYKKYDIKLTDSTKAVVDMYEGVLK